MKNTVVKHEPQAPTPPMLLQSAIEKGVDMAQLEKLMDLQERWEKKEAKKSFLDALSIFQSRVPALKKGRTAKINSPKGFFSYKYADLGSITRVINPLLRDCGLSYRWDFKERADKIEVTCHVSHRDGHEETTSMEAAKDASGSKNDIQQKGSTTTYLQRYTLIGALGLSTADEDSDGNVLPADAKPATSADDKDMTEEDFIDQWKDTLKGVKSSIELKTLYLQNRKTVDGSEQIKALFKQRETDLKPNSKPQTVVMP